MRGPHNIWRLIRTGATFERTGAMRQVLEMVEAPRSLRIAARVLGWPFKWLGYSGDPAQPPILRAVTALGPAYIKFGQMFSTRPDVVGEELAAQLRILQDKLPPFPVDEARREVGRDLGCDVDQTFAEFSEPVAAASLAQVHRAVLRDTGQVVAVKVLRPGIERAFLRDVDAFFLAARMIEILAPFSRRLKPTDVVEHFAGVVQEELDLRMEAAAADEYRAKTENDPGWRVPALVWELSSRRVMTTEWAEGIPFGDFEALKASGHDTEELAARIIQIFLRTALRDGFFHADMHQGNLKLAANGTVVAMDFGIMGRIDTYTRRVYAEILMGFIRRDYDRVAEVHFEAGYVPADRDVHAFSQALRSVGEPIFGQEASHISMARLLAHLFEVTEQFGMQTRTELILLQRTMVVVEGVARGLNPELNMWEVARPVVEKYIRDNLGPRAVIRDLTATVKILSRYGPMLPTIAEEAIIRAHAPAEPKKGGPAVPAWLWAAGGAVAGGGIAAVLSVLL
ncbi:MAG: 2-polyprenylphenol 6-hydroxylase [Paracoccaceae bacterium]